MAISYSSGKVPDVDSLVEEAREANRKAVYHAQYGLSIFEGFDQWCNFYAKHANDLCDALEERERENEDLRRDLIDTNSQLADALRGGETAQANVVGLDREVERLREQVTRLDAYITYRDYDREILDENTRLREEVERLNGIIDAMGGKWIPGAARRGVPRREERDG